IKLSEKRLRTEISFGSQPLRLCEIAEVGSPLVWPLSQSNPPSWIPHHQGAKTPRRTQDSLLDSSWHAYCLSEETDIRIPTLLFLFDYLVSWCLCSEKFSLVQVLN